MKLKFDWHEVTPSSYLGICEHLPDTYCHFRINLMTSSAFWVVVPTLAIESNSNKLIVRDIETAYDFCEDFLNTNIKTILRNQISSMKGSNAPTQKSVSYYEKLLDRVNYLESKK